MAKKRILVIGMSPNTGGVESYILNFLRKIDRNKYEFFFPCYEKIAYEEEIINLGGIIIKLSANRHNPIKYINEINLIFKKYNFDVVYFNTCDIMSMDMIMFGKKFNVPIRIIHSHNSSYIYPPNSLHKLTEKWCKKHLNKYSTKLLACSNVAGSWMFDNNKYQIINNGIDVDRFAFSNPTRNRIRYQLKLEKKFVMGFVGSLWEQKNPLFLIDILKNVKEINPESEMLIVGDGILKEQMIYLSKKYRIETAIKFLGKRADIPELMCAMDAFVLPSNFEGLPFVLVEAQASGLKCFTSTNVSTESNITGEVEFLDLSTSPAIWAKKILNTKSLYQREYYANIVKNKGFDINTSVKELEKIFDNQ